MSHPEEKGRIIMDENKALWKKCVEFHGHECGGLTIGYKASLYAIELLKLELGGGGNAMVAGAQMKDTPVDQALDRLVEAIDKFYEG